MIDSPSYYKTKGKGKLYCNEYSFDISFEFFHINKLNVIYCYCQNLDTFYLSHYVNLKWTIDAYTDENVLFFSSNLLMTQLNEKFIELFPLTNVIIGSFFDYTADKIVYPISNLYDLNLSFSHEDYLITISSEKNSIKKQISKYWNIPQYAAEIKIEKKTELIENYTILANYIIRLLSLATGRHLSIGVQKFYSENKSYTLFLNDNSSSNYINNILPPFEVSSFLQKAIPILYSWEKDKYNDFRITLEYLNATNEGYVDDRILKLIQCYETLGLKWVKQNYKLPNELKELKLKLKSVIQEWTKEFPNYDENGFWSNRIYKSLEWEKAIRLVESVLTSKKLDIEKLDINFPYLIKLRNSVAHSGRFGNEYPIKDLINGQFGLRLFLLKCFEYDGRISDYTKQGYSVIKNINEFVI